jgi:multidrug resistance protein, MATE family
MFKHVPALLKLAGPLILSSSTITLMQIIDALILSRHSSQAVAAMGPSSLAVVLFQGLLWGTSGYAGTFVAHQFGANSQEGVRKSAWLGIHTSWISGVFAVVTAWPLARLFLLAGHELTVTQDEMSYFAICMAGSFFPTLCAALAGWLSGIGRTGAVTAVTVTSFFVNALLAWALILGHWGAPRLGIAGAAISTVAAQMVACALYVVLFARSGGFGDREARKIVWMEYSHFLRLAVPLGLRISGELVAWTFFLVFVGRIGTAELAASSIAFRINGSAFFPALGIAEAAGILVGQARGAGRDQDVAAIGWQSLAVCEIWMLVMAGVFLGFSREFVSAFAGTGLESVLIVACGVVILRFVAFYCLFDAANVMIGYVLSSAGDTRWVARTFFMFSGGFLIALALLDHFHPRLTWEWGLATAFVFGTAITWSIRFQSGAWKRIQVLRESANAL